MKQNKAQRIILSVFGAASSLFLLFLVGSVMKHQLPWLILGFLIPAGMFWLAAKE